VIGNASTDTLTSEVEASLRRTLAYLDRTGFVGADPYDVGTRSALVGLALRAAPNTLRRRFHIAPHENVKARILAARADVELFAAAHPLGTRERARHHMQELWARRLSGLKGAAFGENFGYATRHGQFGAGYPSLVLSALAGTALVQAAAALNEGEWLDRAERIAVFLRDDLGTLAGPNDSISFPYGQGSTLELTNSTAIAAAFLARLGRATSNSEWLDLARRAGRHVLAGQQPDGSWQYSARAAYVDNFHTLFVLDSLHELVATLDEASFEQAYQRGLAFYRSTLLGSDGVPRHVVFPQGPRPTPLLLVATDIRDCAMAIIFCSQTNALSTARDVLRWTLDHMRMPNGLFTFHRFHWGSPDVTFVRPQAWMALAVASYLRAAR
jgi:hypothetical protein